MFPDGRLRHCGEVLEQVWRIIPCGPIHLWLLKLYTWLKNSLGLENVNYTNPHYDWTDSCWSPVDCQRGTFATIYWHCSFSTNRHSFLIRFLFFVLICELKWKAERNPTTKIRLICLSSLKNAWYHSYESRGNVVTVCSNETRNISNNHRIT